MTERQRIFLIGTFVATIMLSPLAPWPASLWLWVMGGTCVLAALGTFGDHGW